MRISKRLSDVVIAISFLVLSAPLLVPLLIVVWLQDFKSPFYVSKRVGVGGRDFKLYKIRSMISGADKSGVFSTSSNDSRITPVGAFVRRWKFDELPQFINVLVGDMSIVGPRPQVRVDVERYTDIERRLTTVRPGITDFSSIVFSDEGAILEGRENPDLAYNQLIRPWKSRLGLFYIEKSSLLLDIKLIFFTALAVVSREKALVLVSDLLSKLGASQDLVEISRRQSPLKASPPPGMTVPVERI
jgi:lipopolysaccharide/colanic/teichoic acid biosynthesis glycosyltransferase